MRLNKAESFLYFLLSVGVFFLTFPTILEVFSVPNPNYVIIPIVLLSLIAHLFEPYLLKVPLYLSVIVASLFFSNWLVGRTPFFTFIIREYRVFKELILGGSGDYSATTSYVIILLFLLILVEFQFYWEKVILVSLICISYLMLLNVFNTISIDKNVLLIACLTLLLKFLLSNGLRQPKLFFVATVLVCFLGLGTLFMPTKNAQMKILANMTPYRNYVTEKGLYRFISNRGIGQLKRTGFGEDDSRLGGAISDDLTVQFEAKQQNAHYWKIDSKSVYTGKGWEKASLEEQNGKSFQDEVEFPRNFADSTAKEDVTLSLFYTSDYVPTTYGQLKISDANNRLSFDKNEITDRVTMSQSNQKREVLLEIEPVFYQEADLKFTGDSLPSNEIDYLQLPADFPEEIRELALEITKDKNSKIEKVLAIQDYLKTNEQFRYSKDETTYPADNQDYVEHFLFETLVGYCDNFSTAMAVMLRSIDIPTRWAKGFNTGSPSGKENGLDIYTIRNSNAHSWVEVYFEGYDWLPFEPTPTFAQPMAQVTDNTSDSTTTQSTNTTPSTTESSAKESSISSNSSDTSEKKDNQISDGITTFTKAKPYLKIFGIVLIIILFILLVKYWLHLLLLIALKRDKFSFTFFYSLLLKKAEKKLARDENQNLITYAKNFEEKSPQFNNDFSYLTKIYEDKIYGNIDSFSEDDRKIIKNVSYLLHKRF